MATQIGTDSLVWGCTDESYGYFEGLEVDEAVESTEARNGAGEITNIEYYGKVHTMSGTYIYRTTGGPLSQVGSGTGITVTDTELNVGTVYVDRVKKTKAQGEFYKIEFEGRYFPSLAS